MALVRHSGPQLPNVQPQAVYTLLRLPGVSCPLIRIRVTEQSLLTVNGQFPGPLLEANWGDVVEVTVHNNITGPAEGTAIHWHG
jgi:FtsP/CotA-like multicopper oxidase with cupredoxin domain